MNCSYEGCDKVPIVRAEVWNSPFARKDKHWPVAYCDKHAKQIEDKYGLNWEIIMS